MNNIPADKNRRVLIIDDNPAIHDDFRKILSPTTAADAALHATESAVFGGLSNAAQQTQFEIDSACQGQDGVLLAQKALDAGKPYAMAFVDVRMPPGWDGMETTRKLWELDPHLQIVLCTAYSDYSWAEMFEKLGHSDGLLILKKPFDAVEAFQLAHALTEKWWLHQQFRRKMEELEGRVAERTRELLQSNHALQTEVAEHQRAEESLRLLGSAVEQSREAITITDANVDLPGPKILFVNPAFTQMTGYTAAEVIGKTSGILQGPRTDNTVLSRLRQNLARGEGFEGEAIHYRKDGTEFDLQWQITPIRNSSGEITHFVAIQRDITTRKKFEAQLFQSQKMETVGKLSGGIAHEFNSILTAIIGQSELILGDLPAESPLVKNANEISKAAVRAATLTRQLLAYGRKQMLQPENIDLNAVLAGMEATLQHLVGRDVDVRIIPAADLKAVKMDPGQIEQVIVNITMNAAAVMPNGGKLTLETANVTLDQEYVSHYSDLKAGEYVMLAITDTGTGISPEVKKNIFEPFFSTKGVGQGTGLGLATCYGILKQSGGHINVYSELARGATFKIYLPQVEARPNIPAPRPGPASLPRGTETILLVEDDPALREMASTLLTRLGYTVLAAADGVEALSLKHQHGAEHVDLVFTDVVMPHMSGKELSDRFRILYPQTKILFTSAYTENAIVHQGVLNPGVTLLQKPFTPSALAAKVREVLDRDEGNAKS